MISLRRLMAETDTERAGRRLASERRQDRVAAWLLGLPIGACGVLVFTYLCYWGFIA